MTALPELIARLEQATEGSRELDADICRVVEPDSVIGTHCAEDDEPTWYSRDGKQLIPYWTLIIDVAMGLVPKELPALVQRNPEPPHVAMVGKFNKLPGRPLVPFRADAPTPALALCIAALRARLSAQPDNQ